MLDNPGQREQETSRTGDASNSDEVRSTVVGVVADPGKRSAKLAEHLCQRLPELLTRWVDDRRTWQVRAICEPAPLDSSGEVPLVKHARRVMARENFDLMVCLTDLPRFNASTPLLGDFSTDQGACQVSLPAAGLFRTAARIRTAVVHQLGEIVRGREYRDSNSAESASLRGDIAPRESPLSSSVRQQSSEEEGIDGLLVLTGAGATARLLSGMVRSNQPWRLVGGLASAAAAAAAAAAFGVFFSTVWALAAAMHPGRLGVISFFAVVLMVVWLIVYNNLWQRPAGESGRSQTLMYNTATTITLAVGAGCVYVVLFVLLACAAAMVIPLDYLRSTLGQVAGWGEYAKLAWLSASMGTVAGALGSGLENEAAIRRVMFSKREIERQDRHREAEQEEEDQVQQESG